MSSFWNLLVHGLSEANFVAGVIGAGMSDYGFDHEWHLGELLDSVALAKIGPALNELLGDELAILDFDETLLWGILPRRRMAQRIVSRLCWNWSRSVLWSALRLLSMNCMVRQNC